ncbi:DMT family transporter [Oceanibaculum pacificum]|uniref:EamA domain-containing protein n=1 Tax=Oceanibaculum pacificum TaxID=580166 RepID=A0A154WG58_9PROT|nr:DMT family transporter [Oceanibaculum pacificum]KZD12511.1 hypothetical protein AUP43_16185 [Oceanibaculum pacificum]
MSRPETDNAKGILLLMLAVGCFSCMDATAKFLLRDHAMPQVLWARYSFHLLAMLLVLGPGRSLKLMRTSRPALQSLRGLLLLGSTGFFFLGIQHIPLAAATSINFLAPLLVVALSAPMLGEKVGPRRWAAVVIGFAGVLVILRPGLGAMHPAAFYILGVALMFAFFSLITRILGRTEDPTGMLLYTAVIGAALASLAAPFYWTEVSLRGWLLFALIGGLGCIGHLVLIKAYLLAEASALAPFSYSQLIWALLLGFILFGDLPDALTVVGAGIVTLSGLYVWHRERQAQHRA